MSEQNVELVESVYAARERGDSPAEGMPYGGVHRGPEAVAQKVLGPINEDVDGLALVREEFIASAGTVAAVVRYTGTGKATGKVLDVPAVHIWDVRDGKLVRFRQFIDTAKFAEVVPADVSVVA
jgi:ketosteroid isomerase-like protein